LVFKESLLVATDCLWGLTEVSEIDVYKLHFLGIYNNLFAVWNDIVLNFLLIARSRFTRFIANHTFTFVAADVVVDYWLQQVILAAATGQIFHFLVGIIFIIK
jgi:hypothetical protein